MNNYKEFFECKIIDRDTPNAKQMQIKQIKSFDFSQAQLENPILNAAIETLNKQIYEKIEIEYDAMILKDAIRKAKIYDSLSNELGCPLEVVFKAIEYGCHFQNGSFIRDPNIYYHTLQYEFVIGYDKNDGSDYEYLKDYGKTWWLRWE